MKKPIALIQSALEEERSEEKFFQLLNSLHKKDSFREGFPLSLGKTSVFKQILYMLSFSYNFLSHKLGLYKTGWWNEIVPHIYLGGLPLQSHIEDFHKLGITSVISLVEDFERRPSLVASPVTEGMWQKEGISSISLPHADFGPVFLPSLFAGAKSIRESLEKNKKTRNQNSVYVHCKAGKSRSAAVVIAYLCTYGGMSVEEAVKTTHKKRWIITLKNKWFHINLYYHLFHAYFGPLEQQMNHCDAIEALVQKNSLN